MFNLTKFQSGFHCEELNSRENPFGTLAERTVGDMYALKDGGRMPRCGLELSFDKLLRGTNGIGHRRKVLNKYLDIIDKEPVNGCDIITTIDVGIQDLAERAVIEELKQPEVNGDVGVAIVMEVKTGDIKAIVNIDKCYGPNGQIIYKEIKNHAVSDLMEPGSVGRHVRHKQDRGHRKWRLAYVRTGDEGPQLAARRIWRHEHGHYSACELQHRREPNHRRVLPQ